ncbi:unnamed protein product, partial [Discosporangium mesarthrocarpum]
MDDGQRLGFFEGAARGLLNREAAGVLAFNLAHSMDGGSRSVQEALFTRSLELFPENRVAVRTYGYRLEQSDREMEALEHYSRFLAQDPDRLDLRLLVAAVCSPHLDSAERGLASRYIAKSEAMHRLVLELPERVPGYLNRSQASSPGKDLIFMPSFSWQYLGYNMRPLMEALCKVLAAIAPGIHEAVPTLHPVGGWTMLTGKGGDANKICGLKQGRISVGVLMERDTNHSPHTLIQRVFEDLSRLRFCLVVFAHENAHYPPAGNAILEAADEVVILPWHPLVSGAPDTLKERELIAAVKLDVLVFMALGNTLGSHLLALGRLAPVQLMFGHGHPVTSGSPGVDYFLSSTLFDTEVSLEAREARAISTTVRKRFDTAAAIQSMDHPGAHAITEHIRFGDGSQDYSEQVVLFDSLSTVYPAISSPNTSSIMSAQHSVGLAGEGLHLYHCMQHSKKLHPEFDVVLREVLLNDPKARILMLEGSKVHLPRWRQLLSDSHLAQLVFVPYRPHSEMMALVAGCHVMLDTFPWGAGVTSLEALSLDVPVVTLPPKVSVLHFALGQVRALGLVKELVASSTADMVTKAVGLAVNDTQRWAVKNKIHMRKGQLSLSSHAVKEWENFLERVVKIA